MPSKKICNKCEYYYGSSINGKSWSCEKIGTIEQRSKLYRCPYELEHLMQLQRPMQMHDASEIIYVAICRNREKKPL